jgi:virginiamycin B lyase
MEETMMTGRFGYGVGAAVALLAAQLGHAHAQAQVALQGQVSSAEEGAMEGVLVTAKKAGSTIAVTVVSDDKGHYSFPAARLAPGHYSVAIRAAGYDLAGPDAADVSAGRAATADLALRKTKRLLQQLTNAEWMASAPGTDDERQFIQNCVGCHTAQRIFQSTHDASEFQQVFVRMGGYSPGSVPTHPQPTVGGAQRPFGSAEQMQPYADWLAKVNLSQSESWDYPLKTFPRPTGRATRVIITEYALPRADAQPHDVIVDRDGMVWYSDFAHQFVGEMDPATGKVTDYPLPLIKAGFPTGTLDLESDPDGNLWVSLMYQTGAARIDRKTKEIKIYPLPAAWQADHTQESFVTPTFDSVDGKVWSNNQDMHATYRLDLASGQWETLGQVKDLSGHGVNAYGMPADHENNLYMLGFGGTEVGKIDAKTGALKIYPTPTPHSRPRRGRVDANDNLWFAEYNGNAIGRFDPKTETITEWKLPTPYSDPYDVVAAANGDVWTGSMLTDRVDRLDPKSGAFVEYLLPHETNIRRVFVDNSATPNALWVGNNHGAAIIKLEPLD